MTNQTKAIGAVVLAAFLGGGIAVATKIALREIPAMSLLTLRFLISFGLIWPFIRKKLPTSLRQWRLVVATTIWAALNAVLFNYGIKFTGATVSQLIYTLGPITTAMIASFILKEKLTQKQIIGIFIGLLGAMIIIFWPLIGSGKFIIDSSLKGNLMMLIGMIAFAIYTVQSKKLQENYSPLVISGIFCLTITIVAAFLAIPDFQTGWWLNVSWQSWLSVGFLAVFIGVIFFWLLQLAIKYGSATIASTSSYLQPVFTFFWAFLILGERLNPSVVFGGGLTILGAYLVMKTRA